MAGMGLWHNLDMSFTTDDERGSSRPDYPGARIGGAPLRNQIKILKDFIYSFDFVEMRRNDSVIRRGVPDHVRAVALVETGKQYAIYFRNKGKDKTSLDIAVDLPADVYTAKWMNPQNGDYKMTENFHHAGGGKTFSSPSYYSDIVLEIRSEY